MNLDSKIISTYKDEFETIFKKIKMDNNILDNNIKTILNSANWNSKTKDYVSTINHDFKTNVDIIEKNGKDIEEYLENMLNVYSITENFSRELLNNFVTNDRV